MLKINNIEVVYSDVILVLRGVSLEVPQGQIVSLLGANGAGKTTTLKAISGLLLREDGAVTRGSIEFDGERLDKLPAEEVTRRGIVQKMEMKTVGLFGKRFIVKCMMKMRNHCGECRNFGSILVIFQSLSLIQF